MLLLFTNLKKRLRSFNISCFIIFSVISLCLGNSMKKLKKNNPLVKAFSHRSCGFGKIPRREMIPNRMYSDLTPEEALDLHNKLEWSAIRIHVDYSKLESQVGEIAKEKVESVKEIIQKSVVVLQKLLKVKPLQKRLMLGEQTKNELPFSDSIKQNGVNADLLLSVEFSNDVTGSTLATAVGIEFEEFSGRPIIGRVRYNKNMTVKKNSIEAGIATAVHEITHVLVFNSDYYSKFFDPKTGKRLPETDVVKEKTVAGQKRKIIITPKVIAAAKKHFNCNSIEGLEVENQGGDGSAFSHWEERLMLGDMMIAEDGAENFISEITLALFEDSGWYMTNKFTGGLFVHGINKGCPFLEETCLIKKQGKTKFKNEFCARKNENTCDASHRQRTFCPMEISTEKIDESYQYFANEKLIGSAKFSDYCPVPFKNDNDTDDLYNNCILGQKQSIKEMAEFEAIGKNSACFISSLMKLDDGNYPQYPSLVKSKGYSHACYEYKCNDSARIVEVVIDGKSYPCPREGGKITIEDSTKKGNIQCMDYNLICNQTVKCYGIYECAVKESLRKELTYDYESKAIVAPSNLE